ncbi:efflux RND transporter permease subunit [Acidocella aquatica]|nr:efflux RND transporter permease subunit [Acidocella aquatica]
MNFPSWLSRHRRSVLMMAGALALAGIAAAVSLPIGLFPNISFPRVRVNISTGDQPAGQMMLQVTQPMEQAVRVVPGVTDITSTTSRGAAQIIIDFAWGTDMTTATLAVNAAVTQLLPSLPTNTNYTVLRMDPTVFPFMAYSLTSKTVSQVKLQNLAQYQIVPLLSAVEGISQVQVQGGNTAEIEVNVDPQRLAAFHLTLANVTQAITAANALQSVGRVEDHDLLYLLLENNAPKGLQDIKDVVLRGGPQGVVRLSDVAAVYDGVQPKFYDVLADGKSAVTVLLFQQRGSNSVAIAKAVQAALDGFKGQIPPGVKVSKWYDQSTLVVAAASSVRDAILIGVVLAAFVLMFFLRSWRITLLALFIVPASMASAILVLSMLGMSFNIMTLGGLAASVGLVIDDVIVMIEHIARRASGELSAEHVSDGAIWTQDTRILHAGTEFLTPLTGSSAATLIVFAPLGFLTGVTGAFFKALSLTMAATLFASWLLTAFAVPLLAGKLIDFQKWHDPEAEHPSWLTRTHGSLLVRVFKQPLVLVVVVALLLGVGAFSFTHVQTGFMPNLDEGGFVMDYQSNPGTSLAETRREIAQVEDILRADPAVDSFSTRIGAGFGGDLNEPNQGDIVVRLTPVGTRPAIDEVMQRLGDQITAQVPGVDTDLHQLMGDEIGDLTGVPQPIEIKLAGSDTGQLDAAAQRVSDAITSIAGVNSVVNGIVPAGDAYDIHVDQVRAAMLGLDPATVAASLNTELAGSVVTMLQLANQQIGVRVQLSPRARHNTDDLAGVLIATPAGRLVPLGQIATFSIEAGQPEITRENLQQIVAVTARIDGRGLGSTIADVKIALGKPGVLGAGVTYTLGGLYQQQQIAFAGLVRVFIAALLAEFVLLLFLYERFALVFSIMGTALLSTTAVFTGLFLTGIELNITALMGMTMIVGIATEMAIFYISEYTLLLKTMPVREALITASANRLRPIAMTTLAAILTLLPLALDLGQGAGMQQPLAIAIISGLLVQFPLVLLALPVLLWVTRPGDQENDLNAL